MIYIFRVLLIFLFIACCAVGEAADIEFSQTSVFNLPEAPIDVAVSSDGDSIYVLTDSGDILVYTSDGQLEDTLHVGGKVDFLTAGSSENQLFVGSTGEKTLRAISLEFIHEIDTSMAPFQGNADAPVVIAVFMDYQCPYCVRLKSILEEVLEQNTGYVKIAYKQFPLKMHKAALSAAEAALVAFEEGKFRELHNLMEDDYKALDNENILDKAESLGFDREAFQQKMADPGVLKRVQQDIKEGKQAGVSGIPTVFINGRKLKKRSLEGFQELIDRELGVN